MLLIAVCVFLSLLILNFILNHIMNLKLYRYIDSILDIKSNDTNTILFLDYKDENNLEYLQSFINNKSFQRIGIVYIGPLWKSNRIKKMDLPITQLYVDEKGDFSKSLGVNFFPYIIKLKNGKIIKREQYIKFIT